MKAVLALLAASAATLVVFAIWPGIDLAVTGLFYDGTGFPLADDPALVALRWVLRVAPFLLVLTGIALFLAGPWLQPRVLGLTRRDWGFVALVFLLGPGLMANQLLKRFWGRARPRNVQEFGGTAEFTAPHVWSDQCAANCSFVSGEVSGATALSVGLILLLAANRRHLPQGLWRAAVVMCVLLPVASAFQRISAGAHFLSDALLATLFTLLIAAVLDRLVLSKHR